MLPESIRLYKSDGLALSLALLLFVGACDLVSSSSSGEGLLLASDQSTYVQGDTLRVMVQNQSEQALYFGQCCGEVALSAQRYAEDGWERSLLLTTICNTYCDGTPLALEPGEQQQLSFPLRAAPGRYRLHILYGEEDKSTAIDLEKVSSEFVVE